jgi:hypothetical protein
MPLAGLTVRLKADKIRAVESETDLLGVALLRPETTEEKTEKIDTKKEPVIEKHAPKKIEKGTLPAKTVAIEVLAPNGEVVARKRPKVIADKPPALLIEVAEDEALKVSFAKGVAWLKAEDAAFKRSEELKSVMDKALARHRDELAKISKNISEAIEKNLLKGGSKDGDHDKDKK